MGDKRVKRDIITMKTFVFGDIHCKPEILDRNFVIAEKLKADKIVFLGDACDEWYCTQQDNINIVEKLIAAKKELGDKFVWLLGNHDWAYYDPSILITGHITEGSSKIRDMLDKNKKMWDLLYDDGFAIYSHAGLEEGFYKEQKDWTIKNLSDECNSLDIKGLNTLKKSPDEYGEFCNPINNIGRSSGGYCNNPSPLWIRPDEFKKPAGGRLNIVGHTPSTTVLYDEYKKLIVCDTFSKFSNGMFIGDQSTLLIEDGQIWVINKYGIKEREIKINE